MPNMFFFAEKINSMGDGVEHNSKKVSPSFSSFIEIQIIDDMSEIVCIL